MRLETVSAIREPDIQVILNTNPGSLTDTVMIGPADICVEVVLPQSMARDYGEKLAEYEAGGVREYWIIDPLRKRVQFNRLDEAGEKRAYRLIMPDDEENYTTPLLPQLALHVPTLWQDDLPGFFAVGQAVQAMLAD